MIRKLVLNDGRSERELVLIGTLVVGRDPSCHINDLDPLLSRRHAEFVANSDGVIVRDLGSRNGILVNGQKVPWQVLTPGDIVQLGHLELKYVEDTTVQAIEHHAKSHATTATNLETPTMAPPPLPSFRPKRAKLPPTEALPESDRPTTKAPIPADLDDTRGPARKAAAVAAPPERPAAAAKSSGDSSDKDATRAPGTKPREPSIDETRAVTRSVPSSSLDVDETRMPMRSPAAAGTTTPVAPGTTARLVADRSLIVIDATGNCLALLGARPDAIIGGQLSETLARALGSVAGGAGASPLTMTVARGRSGGSLTITFTAG